jgi:phosphatidate cytidylyltransferase
MNSHFLSQPSVLALIVVVVSFAVGGSLVFAASIFPAWRRVGPEFRRLYVQEFIIVGALLVPAAFGKWAFLLLLLAIEYRCVLELFDAFGLKGEVAIRWGAAIAGGGLIILAVVASDVLFPALLVTTAVLLLISAAIERGHVSSATVVAVLSLLFPSALIALTAMLRSGHNGLAWIILVYATVEMSDTFALLVGKLIGRRPLLPQLSPNKTVEGFVGGIVVGGIIGYGASRYLLGLNPPVAVAVVACTLVAGAFGDLAVSAVKRLRHIKDFAPVLAAHGGILDIYDSFLFAAPVALLVRTIAGI